MILITGIALLVIFLAILLRPTLDTITVQTKMQNLALELEDLQAKLLQLENAHKWLLKTIIEVQTKLNDESKPN